MNKQELDRVWTTRDAKQIKYKDLGDKHIQDIIYSAIATSYIREFQGMCVLASQVSSIECTALDAQIKSDLLAKTLDKPASKVISELSEPVQAVYHVSVDRKIKLDLVDLVESVKATVAEAWNEPFFFASLDKLELGSALDPI